MNTKQKKKKPRRPIPGIDYPMPASEAKLSRRAAMRLAQSKTAALMRSVVCVLPQSPAAPSVSKVVPLRRPRKRTQLDGERATALRYMKEQLDGRSD